jgi:hypothetical protein
VLKHDELQLSWSPKSLFIEHNFLVRRIDLPHSYEVVEAIQFYKQIGELKSVLIRK